MKILHHDSVRGVNSGHPFTRSIILAMGRPVKVAHFDDSLVPGGAEVILVELCKRIDQYGFEPEVMHFGNPWLKEVCDDLGIDCVEVPHHGLYRSIKTLPFFSAKLAGFLRKRGVDLLHSHLFGSITGGSIAARLCGIRHVGTLHDTHIVEEKPIRYKLLQASSMLGTELVTVSESMKRYYEGLQGIYKIPFRTIYNGVDTGRFDSPHDAGLREELGLDEDVTVFITVARLVEIKRHDVLVRAFSRISSSRPFALLIVGDGPCEEDIRQLVEQLGLADRVIFTGFRNDIPDLLLMSDCFVLSSDSEGLSCSIVEAMAAGLPSVVTDVGGNRELIEDNRSGFVVSPGDPDAMGDCMQRLIDENDLREKFGEEARGIAGHRLTIERTVRCYVDLYNELLSER